MDVDDDGGEAAARRQAATWQPVTWTVVLVAVSVCSATLLAGYSSGVLSGVLLLMDPTFYYEDELIEGLIASASVMGSLVGVLLSWTPFGRKRPLALAAMIGMTAAGFMLWSPNVWVLIAARFLSGYGVGIGVIQVPLFLSECAPASRRGQVVSTSYLFQVVGVLTSYFVNFTVVQLNSEDWRLMLGLILIPATAMLVVTLAVPESPRWLTSRLRLAEATVVLRRLRSDPDIRSELRVILNSLFTSTDGRTEPASVLLSSDAVNAEAEDDKDGATVPLLGAPKVTALPPGIMPTPTGPSVRTVLTRPDARRAFLLCAGLEFFQQFSGIQAVVLYTPIILKASGVAYLFVDLGLSESASVLLMTALIYSCKIPFLFLGMYNVDHLGRRMVLLITLPIMAVALAGVAVSFALPDTTNAGAILAVVATTLFGCSYSPGLGSILSVVESEIFASDVRSTGLVMTGTVGAVFNILVVQLYPLLAASLGELVVFSAFAVSSALGFLYVYALLPETKRQPLELSFRTVLKQPGVVTPATNAS